MVGIICLLYRLGGLSVCAGHFVNVRYWHKADNPAAPAFVHYWSNSGHWSALALNG
jgi:hypothetical protein